VTPADGVVLWRIRRALWVLAALGVVALTR